MTKTRPLAGFRVLDFTQVLAGPLCGQCLADLGADVIKIEPTVIGDDARQWPPLREGVGAVFLTTNRGKRSLAIDLKSPEAREPIRRLVASADVVVEAFALGVADRLGIGYAACKAVKPDIVYCSISGYGRNGPLASLRGYDLVLQAFTGIMPMTGPKASGPTRIPLSPIDQTTGIHAASGIQSALLHRLRTGEGSFLEVSLLETAVSLLGHNLQGFWAKGTLPGKSGAGHETLCPYQVFEASDGPILVGIANNNLWQRFCTFAGRADLLADPRFKSNPERVKNFDATIAVTQEILATRTRAEWLATFHEIGVPCSFVNTIEGLLAEPQLAARGMVMDYEHPRLGPLHAIAYPVQFNGERREVDRPPPLLGQHTDEVLREAGCSAGEIAALRADGVVL